MIAGALIVAALVALLVVGAYSPRLHHHRAVETGVHSRGVDHIGAWEVCTCKAARMTGDRKWRRRQAALIR